MGRIAAFDMGDRWIGIAISDPLGLLARPYKTVEAATLEQELLSLITKEQIQTIIMGLPRTLRGTDSEQTKKTRLAGQLLQEKFPEIKWVFWDERMTSQYASKLPSSSSTSKEAKMKEHARAAAFILGTYLDYLHLKTKNLEQE